jgi:diguanylate cyclase (GGDEF)-like protein
LISVAYAVAVVVNDLPRTTATYVIVVGTMWAAVTVLGSQVSHMRSQADTDPLTGLLNRAGFRVAAEREHALALRTGTPLAMVLLDLDGFKAINDQSGHAAGDRLLAELAVRWKDRCGTLRHPRSARRDEFVLLLRPRRRLRPRSRCDRLRASTPVAFSAGIADWQRDEGMEACLARADKGLYVEKDRRATSPTP